MMMSTNNTRSICLATLLLACSMISSCGQTNDDVEPFPSNDKNFTKYFGPDCGLVYNGNLQGGVSDVEALYADSVTIINSNVVSLRLPSGERIVKLFGIGPDAANASGAVSWLTGLAKDGAYFVPSHSNCVVQTAAGSASTGQVFTPGGRSFSESLIKSELAGSIEATGPCGENLLASCYLALAEDADNPPSSSSSSSSSSGQSSDTSSTEQNDSTSSVSPDSAGEITDFLWKPSAESSYNKGMLVIHVDECNATVYVKGEKLQDYGPGNGRCNTSRAFKPGCAYGTNIKVTVVDNKTGRRYTRNGLPYVLVPNGCNRFEFKS